MVGSGGKLKVGLPVSRVCVEWRSSERVSEALVVGSGSPGKVMVGSGGKLKVGLPVSRVCVVWGGVVDLVALSTTASSSPRAWTLVGRGTAEEWLAGWLEETVRV